MVAQSVLYLDQVPAALSEEEKHKSSANCQRRVQFGHLFLALRLENRILLISQYKPF